MLLTTDIATLKTVAKNLGQSLKNDYNTQLSHSATLNLAARAFGFENYNTAKASLEDSSSSLDISYEASYHLMRSIGVSDNDTHEIITWYKKYVDYGAEDMYQSINEVSEYITDSENSTVDEIYMSLWAMVIQDAYYFMTKSGKSVCNYSIADEPIDKIVPELRRGDIAGPKQAAYYQMSVEELKNSINKAKYTGKNLSQTASAVLVSQNENEAFYELLKKIDVIGSIGIKDLEKIFKVKDIDNELKRLTNTNIEILLNNKEKITEKAISQFGKHDNFTYIIEVPTMVSKCFE